MRFRNSGKGSDGEQLAVPGQKPGAAVVSLPGSAVYRVVEEGDEIMLADDVPIKAILSACPSLVLIEESKKAKPAEAIEAPAFIAAPAEKKQRKHAAKE